MKVKLMRQTTWGTIRYFTIYKNGISQRKLFNNIPVNLDVNVGDVLEFREGLFKFCNKIVITEETKEVIIQTTNQMKQLFLLFIFSFLAVSLVSYSLTSLRLFLFTEVSAFMILHHLFRHFSYFFIIQPAPVKKSAILHSTYIKNAHSN